jgi:RNA-splicing ligase RtcB
MTCQIRLAMCGRSWSGPCRTGAPTMAAPTTGARGDLPPERVLHAGDSLETRYQRIVEKHPKARAHKTAQLGTLGTGNHFIELCLDEDDFVWVMLHSGSRGVGNRIGTLLHRGAKRRWSATISSPTCRP